MVTYDLFRMANTLAHVKDLHWIVVEDSNQTVTAVERILQRSQLPYTYIAHNTAEGYPAKGWFQRTKALQLLREKAAEILGSEDRVGVVYFGDDDNSYDIRLFEDYIRNVKKLGMWAVGLVGGAYVEAPRVEEGKVIFDVGWAPNRQFAVDMAGFAINIRDVLRSEAVFGTSCPRGSGAPETCLLEDMGFRRTDIEVFSYGEPVSSGRKSTLEWSFFSGKSGNPGVAHQDTPSQHWTAEEFDYTKHLRILCRDLISFLSTLSLITYY